MKCGKDVICTPRTRVVFVLYVQGVEQGADVGPGKCHRHSRRGHATAKEESTNLFRKRSVRARPNFVCNQKRAIF